uniref:Uncharacterized protein n=1 Tax=Chromera velia CCMP2878 TaxID=1169474 RepID=A0A0G4GUM8_9ALVE|eukprot:Cvel_5238.t1-p1 / transcript=Cvel_5238.t1 / gene=Cvel_5238 / organism=Chromera_velia_CCMP2878 / gene_product=hypothetical protein / transcript_product=hypothetical protein / location=Cvel_scaffold241:59310-64172(+) / protein_length=852 / sequence_SO=supercontig / SO=protein_coding / is_pseudo=false
MEGRRFLNRVLQKNRLDASQEVCVGLPQSLASFSFVDALEQRRAMDKEASAKRSASSQGTPGRQQRCREIPSELQNRPRWFQLYEMRDSREAKEARHQLQEARKEAQALSECTHSPAINRHFHPPKREIEAQVRHVAAKVIEDPEAWRQWRKDLVLGLRGGPADREGTANRFHGQAAGPTLRERPSPSFARSCWLRNSHTPPVLGGTHHGEVSSSSQRGPSASKPCPCHSPPCRPGHSSPAAAEHGGGLRPCACENCCCHCVCHVRPQPPCHTGGAAPCPPPQPTKAVEQRESWKVKPASAYRVDAGASRVSKGGVDTRGRGVGSGSYREKFAQRKGGGAVKPRGVLPRDQADSGRRKAPNAGPHQHLVSPKPPASKPKGKKTQQKKKKEAEQGIDGQEKTHTETKASPPEGEKEKVQSSKPKARKAKKTKRQVSPAPAKSGRVREDASGNMRRTGPLHSSACVGSSCPHCREPLPGSSASAAALQRVGRALEVATQRAQSKGLQESLMRALKSSRKPKVVRRPPLPPKAMESRFHAHCKGEKETLSSAAHMYQIEVGEGIPASAWALAEGVPPDYGVAAEVGGEFEAEHLEDVEVEGHHDGMKGEAEEMLEAEDPFPISTHAEKHAEELALSSRLEGVLQRGGEVLSGDSGGAVAAGEGGRQRQPLAMRGEGGGGKKSVGGRRSLPADVVGSVSVSPGRDGRGERRVSRSREEGGAGRVLVNPYVDPHSENSAEEPVDGQNEDSSSDAFQEEERGHSAAAEERDGLPSAQRVLAGVYGRSVENLSPKARNGRQSPSSPPVDGSATASGGGEEGASPITEAQRILSAVYNRSARTLAEVDGSAHSRLLLLDL